MLLDYHGWGIKGPWSGRGGFDQLACAATGFSAEEGSFDGPRLPPTYLLNDYLAAVLGAAGVLEALRRRARDGGTYRVHIDLARVCMWIQDLGLFPRAQVADLPLRRVRGGSRPGHPGRCVRRGHLPADPGPVLLLHPATEPVGRAARLLPPRLVTA